MNGTYIASKYDIINISPSRKELGVQSEEKKKIDFLDGKRKIDFSKIRYNLKEFFNEKDDQTKINCSLANDYSPFHSGAKRWEQVTKLIMSNQDYSGDIIKKRKDTQFNLIKNYPFVYKNKKANIEKNI